MSSSEKFNFSKSEDMERFEKLDESGQEKIADEAYAEAVWMQYKIKVGLAVDYAEAAKNVGLENRIKEIREEKISELSHKLEDIKTKWEEKIEKGILQKKDEYYINTETSKKYPSYYNASYFAKRVDKEGEKLVDEIESLEKENFNRRESYCANHLPGTLDMLKEKGEDTLGERYSEELLQRIEKYAERNGCRMCFLTQVFGQKYWGGVRGDLGVGREGLGVILTIGKPEADVDKSVRLLTLMLKTREWSSNNEGDGDQTMAEAADEILELVDRRWLSIPVEKKKEFIEVALNELHPVFAGGIKYWHGGKQIKEGARGKLAHLIASLDTEDQEYKTSKLSEWNDKFPNALMPIDALTELMKSDSVNAEDKQSLIDEIWRRSEDSANEHQKVAHSNVNYLMQALLTAAESGVEIPDFEGRIVPLVEKVRGSYYPDSETLENIEVGKEKIKALLGQNDGSLGSGFQTRKAELIRGDKLYLDGKLLGIPENAEFSKQPANDEMITWVSRELIDYDRAVKGSQWRDNVYVWKRGWESPQRIYEDHAYESERHFKISPPVVTPDGSIEIEISSDGKTERKTLNIE